MVDAYYKAREKRLAAEDKIEEMKKAEAAQKATILQALKDAKLDGAKGKVCTVAVTSTEVPQIVDAPAFYAHILATGSVDLLEKRASKSGCAARWADGEAVPGVEKFVKTDLSFTKAHK
jgi:hypothetical protein